MIINLIKRKVLISKLKYFKLRAMKMYKYERKMCQFCLNFVT